MYICTEVHTGIGNILLGLQPLYSYINLSLETAVIAELIEFIL